MGRRDANGALEAFLAVLDRNSDHYPSYLNLGMLYNGMKNFELAIEAFEEASQLRPGLLQPHLFLAQVFLAAGHLEEAEVSARGAIAIDPKQSASHYVLGLIYKSQGKIAESVLAFKLTIELGKSGIETRKAEKQIALFKKHVDRLFSRGLKQLGAGEIEAGKETFNRIRSIDPDNASASYNLGIIFNRKGKKDQAIEAFKEALEKNPKLYIARLLLGQTYEGKDMIAEAIHAYQQVLSEVPDKEQTEGRQAKKKLNQVGNTPKTGKRIQTLLSNGERFAKEGDLDEARKTYLKILSILPKQVFARFSLGLIALRRKEIKAAEGHFLRATRIDPNHFPSLLRLGEIYEGQIKERPFIHLYDPSESRRHQSAFSKAITLYQKAAAIRPDDPLPPLRLGLLFEKKGRQQKALEAYRQVLAVSGGTETPESRLAKGQIDFHKKRFHVSFNDVFLNYDSNRRRSSDPESELSSNLSLGLIYHPIKTIRFRLPIQLIIQNSLLHRSQIFFNNEDLSVKLITSSSDYTFLQGYRLSYGFSGGSAVPDRASYTSQTLSGDIIRRGLFPSQTSLHLDVQSFQSETNPVFDATRQTARLSVNQKLNLKGRDKGQIGLSYRFLDNNVTASDQANRSHTLSLSYNKALSPGLSGSLSLSQTYFRYRHPDSLAVSEGKTRFRRNRLTSWSVDLSYSLEAGVSLFAGYRAEENKSNLPAAEALDLTSLNAGQASSLGAYQRKVITFGASITSDVSRPYPKWSGLGKHLRMGLTAGYYRPSLKGFHAIISNPRSVIPQDPNHLLPSNPDFRSESRNITVSEMGGAISMGLEVEWAMRPHHSLVFNLSEWQNAAVAHDRIPLLLSSASDPEIVPRSARYNLVINQYLLSWRYTAWKRPKQGRFYFNIGLLGIAFANLTIDSLVKLPDPPIGPPFASLGSAEARGRGFTTRAGFGGEYFLTSWLSFAMNANYVMGSISKLTIERNFRADFLAIPEGLPGVEDNPCFRQIDRETEGETLQVASCDIDQQIEGTSLKNVTLRLDGFEASAALHFHFGLVTPIETALERLFENRPSPDKQALLAKWLRSHLQYDGSLKNETAYRFFEPVSFTKAVTLFRLNATWSFNSNIHLRTRFRAFYDAIYDLVDIDTISPRRFPNTVLTQLPRIPTSEEVSEIEIQNSRGGNIIKQQLEFRELYLDIQTKSVDLRIGRQIARWGVVEGARITDELNPFDFSEFILRDIEDRYIPLMMVKANLYLEKTTFEVIFIPEVVPHKPAPKGSEFEQFEILPGFVRPKSYLDSSFHLNEDKFENSEVAARLIRSFSGWELSISGFYTWDDFPSTFRTIEGGVGSGFQTPPKVTFSPRLTRLKILGTTLSKSFGKIILNSEFAYTFGKFFGTRLKVGNTNPTIELGELQRDFIKYGVGLDFSLFGFGLSLQFLQQQIFDWQEPILRDRIDTVTSIFARKSFLNNQLDTQILILYFVNEDDFLLRPKLETSLTDKLKLRWGADLFIGDRGDQVGEFDFIGFFKDSDRIYIEVIYSF